MDYRIVGVVDQTVLTTGMADRTDCRAVGDINIEPVHIKQALRVAGLVRRPDNLPSLWFKC